MKKTHDKQIQKKKHFTTSCFQMYLTKPPKSTNNKKQKKPSLINENQPSLINENQPSLKF